MKNKLIAKVGDRVVYAGQPKTAGCAVEIDDSKEKNIKVHWSIPPVGENIHRNGRGSYSINQLKLMRI
jgi:hypothetical protein